MLDPGLRASRRRLQAGRLHGTSETCSNRLETVVGFCSARVGDAELGGREGWQRRACGQGDAGHSRWPRCGHLCSPRGRQHGTPDWATEGCLVSGSTVCAELGRGRRGLSRTPGSDVRTGTPSGCVDRAAALSEPRGARATGWWRGVHLLRVPRPDTPSPSRSWNPREGKQRWAQGRSRRRVPGHLSHRKGTRRRVKVAVKV